MFPNLNYVLNKRSPDINLQPPDHDDPPEMYCSSCKSFTTDYNWHGECKEHGTVVTEDVTEVEE